MEIPTKDQLLEIVRAELAKCGGNKNQAIANLMNSEPAVMAGFALHGAAIMQAFAQRIGQTIQ